MTEPGKLIHAYIEGDLSPEQASELSTWVEQNDMNAEQFVRACVQHYLLREQAVGMDLAGSVFSVEDAKAEDPQGLTGPNQRLTLAKGFAEITTVRGATVLVQSPATIETTGSDNAIRLHRGKLVGRCETQASKGLVVHAPGMDVVDLGTEFGVEADAEHGSTVLVMEGSVRAQPAKTSPLAFEPVVLEQDQARRVKPEAGTLEMIAVGEVPVFQRSRVHPYVDAVMRARPIAYWRFENEPREAESPDEVSVLNVVDDQAYSLRTVGSATFNDDGLLGASGQLNNKTVPRGFFELNGQMHGLKDADALTIEFWFSAEDHQLGSLVDYNDNRDPAQDPKHIVVVELQSRSDLTNADALSNWEANTVRTFYNSPPATLGLTDSSHNLFSSSPYLIKQWHHVVLVKTRGDIKLYVDGRLAESKATGLDKTPVGHLLLGVSSKVLNRSLDGDKDIRSFTGAIDEVAVYGRALSQQEIARHWALAKNLVER